MYVPTVSTVHTHMLASRMLHCSAGLFADGDREGLGGASVVAVTESICFRAVASSGSSPGIAGVLNSAAAEAATGATVRL